MNKTNCPNCGVKPGGQHIEGCDPGAHEDMNRYERYRHDGWL